MRKALVFCITLVFIGGLLLAGCNGASDKEELKETEMITIGEDTYRMTFSDDFDGNKLDKKKWSLCPEWERGGGELSYAWDDSMTTLDGEGNLVLGLGKDSNGDLIAGAVRTRGKFEQTYGYYETRCKLQSAPATVGAFWLMCDAINNIGNGAVDGAEIDIFESFNANDGLINHAVHWDGYGDDHEQIAKSIHRNIYDGEYHTFALLWDEKGYTFYIDGKVTWSLKDTTSVFPGSCSVPCYIKLTAAFDTWGGTYDPETIPDQLVFDYVKVYEKCH